MPAPERIKKLIETFEQNINDYRFKKNETELRREFLDPFFEALGWDIDNKQGKDERHKEVAHEFSVEIDGQQKKADYAFRTEQDIFDFLVEAKKPSVKVESNVDAAFQIRRYGWSAKIPVNILTDFEHLAIYDCRTRPNYAKDDAKTGRIELIHYKDYLTRWDEIVNLFSPDAIRNGALNEYTDGLKSKKGTQEVDDAFLEEIEGWREALAKNIATRNKDKNLSEDQINYVVQMTIDRIIFLRIAEERGMEKDRRLFELMTPPALSGTLPKSTSEKTLKSNNSVDLGRAGEGSIYKDLLKFFSQADERYNSGLFHFKKDKDRENPDTLSQSLEIDDKVLKDIIKDLYYPSPYAFTYIPTEILGSVYERFLGKVIRLTASGNAKVEEKPEVRKAGGVYYTPSYIVEYIVKNTIGKLVEGKTPDEVSKIKIVDPACGSGSFLLGAYQFLLDWHLDYYISNQTEKWVKNKTLLTADNKTYRLSIDEKKRILLNNIHGVDLDPQAVEVTKLSLLLKVVEDPGQLKMFEEGHILPNLNKNIKNGNALIGTDYFSGQMFNDIEEMKRVRPFDWEHEFPEIFKRGGFDIVIGNPPWAFTKYVDWGEDTKDYIQSNYLSIKTEQAKSLARQAGKINLFAVFTLKGISLLKPKGLFSYIIPNNILRTTVYDVVRKQILENWKIQKIADLKDGVFKGVTASTVIIIVEAAKPENDHLINIVENNSTGKVDEIALSDIKQKDSLYNPSYVINIFSDDSSRLLIEKVDSQSTFLGELVDVLNGIATEKNMAGVLEKKIDKNSKPILFGKDIARYQYTWSGKYIDYVREKLLRARDESLFLFSEKLIMQRIGGILITAYDNEQYYTFNSVNNLLPKENTKYNLKYLLGMINSQLLRYYYISRFTNKSSLTVNISKTFLDKLPIRTINFNEPAEKSQHDKMVSLVEKMLALHKSLQGDGHFGSDRHLRTPQEQELIQRQITSTDKAIDSLVYELYGLTEEEIDIVEGK